MKNKKKRRRKTRKKRKGAGIKVYPGCMKFKNIIRKKGTINGCNRCGYLKPRE